MTSARLGTITAGGTAYDVRLASWRPNPFQVSSRLVFPEFQDIPGAQGKVSGDPNIRLWYINDWTGGEGETYWEEGLFNQSSKIVTTTFGDGIELGPLAITTQHDNATPADFTEARRFGLAQGKLWAVRDATVHEWQPSTENWDETGTATGSSNTPTCVIDQGDGTNLLVGYHSTHAIRQVAPGGANAAVTGLSFTYAPVLRNWGGTLYWLDGDDLYSFTMSGAAATGTLVSDVGGNSSDYLTNGYEPWNRMSLSDKGPIWYQRTNSGETYVWEYNVATSTTQRLAKLPVDFATPYSIFFSHGFYFVGFRYADGHTLAGPAYLFAFRGAQRYTPGPFRDLNVTDQRTGGASKPVLIAGVVGDDLMVEFAGGVWAYNLSTGGITLVGTTGVTTARDMIAFGQDVFVSDSTNFEATRFKRGSYQASGTLNTGRFDFGYKGVDKVLLDVTVVTDPLPANTSVTLKYATEGGSFAAATGTHETDSATEYTWTISTSTTSVVGKDFELQLALATTSSSATPTVRSVTARAIGAEREVLYRLEVDAATQHGGIEGISPRSADALADLNALATYNGVVSFSHAFDVEAHDAETATDCVIVDISNGPSDPNIMGEAGYAIVELRRLSYV